MSRTAYLSTLVAIVAWSPLLAFAAAPYCLAGQPCFPSDAILAKFNASVDGLLIKSAPYGAPCYTATYNAEQCAYLANNKGSIAYRDTLAAGVMFTNLEQLGTVGCPVPDPNPDGSAPAPVAGNCTLGNMPAYVVNATSTAHIVASVQFAAKYNLRLRVKNSGHDYTGRSSGAGAFSVWTRHLNDAKLIENFVPKGCNTIPHDVVSAGPGVNVEELYRWGGQNGRVTIGGYTVTVGATGGYLVGGGGGPLAPIFGLGVDNVLQFEMITADGQTKIANECTNTDLFWALRGGGGGFGINTRVYLKAYPAFKAVNAINGTVGCADKASFDNLIATMIQNQVDFREKGHMGIFSTSGEALGMVFITVAPFQANDTIRSSDESVAEMSAMANVPGCLANINAQQYSGPSGWFDAYDAKIWPTVNSVVGANLQDMSRLVSYDMINDPVGVQKITDWIINLPPSIPFIWENSIGAASAAVDPETTAMHPAWRNAFAWIDLPNFGPWSGSTAEQNATSIGLVKNATAVLGPVGYYNEDYPWEDDWEASFFGPHYARLLAVKKAVDPHGVFSCLQCVGSEDGY